MLQTFRFAILVACASFSSGAFGAEPARDAASRARPAVRAGNAFALDLYRHAAGSEGNLFFSPYSAHVALAMTLAGARGETAEEMAKVLRLEGTGDEAFGALAEALAEASKRGDRELFQLSVANALWGQRGFPFDAGYIRLLEGTYRAKFEALDFARATEAARAAINRWTAERTANKIPELLAEGILHPLVRLVLTNAVYFRSAWEHPFEPGDTKEGPFRLADGRTVQVPFMRQTARLAFAEGGGFQAVEIPYAGGGLAMVVVLPEEAGGLTEIEREIARLPERLETLDPKRPGAVRPVDLSIPRFRIERELPLKALLQAMGMKLAFDRMKADFSGMTGARDLFISKAVHKAFVDVDERGTEAAAATAVVMALRGPAKPETPVVFRADRPFLFLIRERSTGAILFLGRVLDPSRS